MYQESGRISTIACSVLDPAWAEQVKVRGKMLFIIEGLTMYIVRGMPTLNPVYKLVTWMPIVKRFAEKILVFEKA